MQPISTQFESELKKRIGEYIAHVSNELSAGTGIENIAQYQHRVGQIYALNRVMTEFCDDANKVINQR